MPVMPGSRSGGGGDGKPQTVEWRAIGEGVMMVSILHEGRLYKGALTVQVCTSLPACFAMTCRLTRLPLVTWGFG